MTESDLTFDGCTFSSGPSAVDFGPRRSLLPARPSHSVTPYRGGQIINSFSSWFQVQSCLERQVDLDLTRLVSSHRRLLEQKVLG